MSPKDQLATYVQPELSEARTARLWAGVAERLNRPRRGPPRWVWQGAALAGVAAAAALVVVPRWMTDADTPSAWTNAKLQTASDSMDVALEDGSTIHLASATRVDVAESKPSSVRLRLERGSVLCDVARRPDRQFAVLAEGVEVRVIGTRFAVKVDETTGRKQVNVQVERGIVEVVPPGGRPSRRLSGGESWTVTTGPAAPAPSDDAAPIEAPEPEPRPAKLTPRNASPPPNDGDSPTLQTENARQLLERGNEARRLGDASGAAAAYEQLLKRYPGDGRAGLAAFELGRLRMDRLDDPSGAVHALNRAVQLGRGSAYREDALARLTLIYHQQGATDRCRRAKQLYLASYPNGVHVARMQQRCGD